MLITISYILKNCDYKFEKWEPERSDRRTHSTVCSNRIVSNWKYRYPTDLKLKVFDKARRKLLVGFVVESWSFGIARRNRAPVPFSSHMATTTNVSDTVPFARRSCNAPLLRFLLLSCKTDEINIRWQ